MYLSDESIDNITGKEATEYVKPGWG